MTSLIKLSVDSTNFLVLFDIMLLDIVENLLLHSLFRMTLREKLQNILTQWQFIDFRLLIELPFGQVSDKCFLVDLKKLSESLILLLNPLARYLTSLV